MSNTCDTKRMQDAYQACPGSVGCAVVVVRLIQKHGELQCLVV